MFCPNCGKELPEGIRFCAYCGKLIINEKQENTKQDTLDTTISAQKDNDIQEISCKAMDEDQESSILMPTKQANQSKMIMGIALALVVILVGVFAVRLSNEQALIQQIPWAIYDDETQNDIRAYYKDYIGEEIMTGCNAEDFSVKSGSKSNTFDVNGVIEVTDMSQPSRPTYNVNVAGTVTTNFFRTEYSINYTLQYQIPESQVPEDQNIISIETLFQAYHSNAALADNTYANQYLNVSGTITKIRNTYSNTVEVEFGIPTKLFYAYFEFDPNDTALYSLQVGDQITLTGFLKPGEGTYTLHFSNASLYQRNASNSGTDSPEGSVAYPPVLPPIDPNDPNADIYSRYFGLYVNKEGYALEVGMSSNMYSSYYARIYQSLSDARNYAEPLLEVSGGEADYGTGAMSIIFSDVQGEVLLFRDDDRREGNYTFELSADGGYYGGVSIAPFAQSIYYMIERGIDMRG